MATLINVVILLIAIILLALAALFLVRSVQARASYGREAYNFGQQEAVKLKALNRLKAVVAAITGLILLGVFLIRSATNEQAEPAAPIEEPTAIIEAEAPTAAVEDSVATATLETVSATPTSPIPTATVTLPPTETPIPSETPLPTRFVNSPNGLYLRDVAGGTAEVELLADGASVTLLGETASAKDLLWQRVRTQAGNEGWVADDFLSIEPPAQP